MKFIFEEKYSENEIQVIRKQLNELGEKLSDLSILENVIRLKDIVLMPRRDAIVIFAWYNVLIANEYGDTGSLATFTQIIDYLNTSEKDKTSYFERDLIELFRKKFFIYKLVHQFRKVQSKKYQDKTIVIKKFFIYKSHPTKELTNQQKTLISRYLTPSYLFMDIANLKSKQSYSNVVKYVYFIDRVARSLTKTIKEQEDPTPHLENLEGFINKNSFHKVDKIEQYAFSKSGQRTLPYYLKPDEFPFIPGTDEEYDYKKNFYKIPRILRQETVKTKSYINKIITDLNIRHNITFNYNSYALMTLVIENFLEYLTNTLNDYKTLQSKKGITPKMVRDVIANSMENWNPPIEKIRWSNFRVSKKTFKAYLRDKCDLIFIWDDTTEIIANMVNAIIKKMFIELKKLIEPYSKVKIRKNLILRLYYYSMGETMFYYLKRPPDVKTFLPVKIQQNCVNCGGILDEKDNFCQNCGKQIY